MPNIEFSKLNQQRWLFLRDASAVQVKKNHVPLHLKNSTLIVSRPI
jgi:hypothetical protein